MRKPLTRRVPDLVRGAQNPDSILVLIIDIFCSSICTPSQCSRVSPGTRSPAYMVELVVKTTWLAVKVTAGELSAVNS